MGPQVLSRPDVAEVLNDRNMACICTIGKDGTPHQAYVWYKWDGEYFITTTSRGKIKHRNAERTPLASVSVLDLKNPYRNVFVSGKVECTFEKAEQALVDLSIRYMGEKEGPAYVAPYVANGQVIIKVKAERIHLFGF